MPKFLIIGKSWVRYLLFFVTVGLIIYWIPKQRKFQYEFEQGKPWMHENLIAPFSFPIEKTQEELKKEQTKIKDNFKPYYSRDPQKEKAVLSDFRKSLRNAYLKNKDQIPRDLAYYEKRGSALLKNIYDQGIIRLDENHQAAGKDFGIVVVTGNVAEDKTPGQIMTPGEAEDYFREKLKGNKRLNKPFFRETLEKSIKPTIFYDKDLSEKRLQELYGQISLSKGLIQEGEKIISRGSIVTEERYRILSSLKKHYETQFEGSKQYLVTGGYSLLIIFLFVIYGLYINYFKRDVFRSNKSLLLIFINILLFSGLTIYLSQRELFNVYLIPYAAAPIILLAFFGSRVAFITHLLIILIAGMIVPNGFEFIFLQIMAGFMTILTMLRIRYLSQFFIAALLIVFSYYVDFIGLKLIQVGSLTKIEWTHLLWFTGNFILILLAYPLIYAFEKIFGFVSDITLMELSDINKKLLRKLAMRAPGTFQHSLQVGNLGESVLNEIGGNALLARVGALYHDIGKMENPQYFVENQKYLANPHDEISDQESTRFIIEHVPRGVEIAREYGLPEEIIKFIRTHHGTSRVEFFYRNYLQTKPGEEVDEGRFRYPGPKPFSKETAVVMLVDSVEAASRSLQQPGGETLDNLVDKVIGQKLKDNQLENADISLREIKLVRTRLKKLLKSIYHVRVEYPEAPKEKKEE